MSVVSVNVVYEIGETKCFVLFLFPTGNDITDQAKGIVNSLSKNEGFMGDLFMSCIKVNTDNQTGESHFRHVVKPVRTSCVGVILCMSFFYDT